MPVKATKRPKTITAPELKAMLKKKGSKATASMNLLVKYSAASIDLFDFEADMDFYEFQMVGKDISAKKIVLRRLIDLIEQGGKLLEGNAMEKGSVAYMTQFIDWAENDQVIKKKRGTLFYQRVTNQAKAYKEILKNNKKRKK